MTEPQISSPWMPPWTMTVGPGCSPWIWITVRGYWVPWKKV